MLTTELMSVKKTIPMNAPEYSLPLPAKKTLATVIATTASVAEVKTCMIGVARFSNSISLSMSNTLIDGTPLQLNFNPNVLLPHGVNALQQSGMRIMQENKCRMRLRIPQVIHREFL